MISERVGFRASIGYKVRNVVSNQIFESQRGRWWDTNYADTNSTTHTDTKSHPESLWESEANLKLRNTKWVYQDIL